MFVNSGVINTGNAISIKSGPAATLPPFGVLGRFYCATDTSEWLFDTGAEWINLTNNGGGGGFLPLTGGTLTGALAGTSATFSGNITGASIIRSGGTSAQFLKADGSVDNTTYASTAALAGYLPLTGGTLTGALAGTSANFSGNIQAATFNGSALGSYAYRSSGLAELSGANFTGTLAIEGGSLITSGSRLAIASQLTTGRTGTYQVNTLSSIHNWFDDNTIELAAGSTSGWVSGVSVTGNNASSFAGTVRFLTASSERMRINASGSVGIGTTSPSALLHVVSNGEVMRLQTTASVGNNYMYFANNSGNMGYLGYGSANNHILLVNELSGGDIAFYTGGFDRLRISSTGAATFSSSVTAVSFIGSGAGITSLNGSNIANGTVAPGRLGSGTPSSGTALFGDNTWKSTSIALSGQNNTNAPSSGTPAVCTTANNVEQWQRIGNIIFVQGSFILTRVSNGVSTLTFTPPIAVVNLVTQLTGSFLWNDNFATHLKSSSISIDGTNVFCNVEINGTFSTTSIDYFYSYNI